MNESDWYHSKCNLNQSGLFKTRNYNVSLLIRSIDLINYFNKLIVRGFLIYILFFITFILICNDLPYWTIILITAIIF